MARAIVLLVIVAALLYLAATLLHRAVLRRRRVRAYRKQVDLQRWMSLRATDYDRQAVITALGDAYTTGQLTQAEHEQRVTMALEGRTRAEVRRVLGDLSPAVRL
ncbi:DUF1707 domain-containing protein [Microtetraspora fusca]|uniref:DUF1707 domain-containing protein n=1 Tax=Microtetraspora fusca TaxID=1997 RepID=A0ABW6VEE3_MICFU